MVKLCAISVPSILLTPCSNKTVLVYFPSQHNFASRVRRNFKQVRVLNLTPKCNKIRRTVTFERIIFLHNRRTLLYVIIVGKCYDEGINLKPALLPLSNDDAAYNLIQAEI